MDWVSHFSQILQSVFQSITALIVAIAALLTGIATFIGARASLRSHREKARRASYKTIPNKAAEKEELTKPKSGAGNKIEGGVQSPSPISLLSGSTADPDKPHIELVRAVRQTPEVELAPTKQTDPRRVMAQTALKAVSGMVELAHNMAERSRRSSRSVSQYRSQLLLLEALAIAVPDLQRLAKSLDNALNKLDIIWDGDDPRNVLFGYIDPLHHLPGNDPLRACAQPLLKKPNV